MLGKTGLLVVSNPNHIGKILPTVQQHVKNTLYIQLLSALTEPFGNFHTNIFTSWPKYSQTIRAIYSQAAVHCQDLDVCVLLEGIKYKSMTQIKTTADIDFVIFDKKYAKRDIDRFIKTKISTIANKYEVLTLDSGKFELPQPSEEGKTYKHVVLGGTFDRLHTAHKLLLSEACLRSEGAVTVGVTEECMLQGKILWELIEDIKVRSWNVQNCLADICGGLNFTVTPIRDPFGPSTEDPTMDMIVVSEETIKGAHKINEIRKEKGLSILDIFLVSLIDEPNPDSNEEDKISSSTTRIRVLGTLLRPVSKKDIPDRPYIIGLTGGVASGKSSVAKYLEQLGAETINCDLIGHGIYKCGKPCHAALVEHFGERILAADGEIDRKILGGIVFSDPTEMKVLNELVWPQIGAEINQIIRSSRSRVVVVEGAVLLKAGWDRFCHEVWCTLVPRDEAVKRIVARNNLTEEEAKKRIDSQESNKSNVAGSNVVICPLWDVEFTRKQVDKAWQLLQQRMGS